MGRSPFKTQMGKWCDEHTCRDRASHKMDVAKSDTMSGGCGLNGKRAICHREPDIETLQAQRVV